MPGHLRPEPDKLWDTGDLSGDPFAGAWAYEIWINSNDPESYQYIMGSQAYGGYNADTILQYPYADADKGPKILIYDVGRDSKCRLARFRGAHRQQVGTTGCLCRTVFGRSTTCIRTGHVADDRHDELGRSRLPESVSRGTRVAGRRLECQGHLENFTGQIDEFAIYDLDGVDDLPAAGLAIARHYFVGPAGARATITTAVNGLDGSGPAGDRVDGGNPLAYDLNTDEKVDFNDRQVWVTR